jgi:hypothetical protein
MRKFIIAAIAVLTFTPVAHAAQVKGLVGCWTFDDGRGTTAKDTSGKKNHGTIHGGAFAKRGNGYAMHFTEEGDFIDCGADPSLRIESFGTVEFWCRPEAHEGGLVNWSTGVGWNDERFVLAFNTYRSARGLIICFADGQGGRHRSVTSPPKDTWTHIAVTRDRHRTVIYHNGVQRQVLFIPDKVDLKDVPLWIGRCQGLGKETFKGKIDEVRVYNRPLTSQEIVATYTRNAASFGKDVAHFTRPRLSVQTYADTGRVAIQAECALMWPLPRAASLEASLHRGGDRKPLVRETGKVPACSSKLSLVLPTGDLDAGSYQLLVTVKDGHGDHFGGPAVETVQWPGQTKTFRGVKVLNNMVWELINEHPGALTGTQQFKFTQPRRRWVYVACTAETTKARLSVSVDKDPRTKGIIVLNRVAPQTREAMRFLPAGEHTLTLTSEGLSRVDRIVVRSIPELIYANYGANPQMAPHGPYDERFMTKYIFRNVNTFAGRATEAPARAWRAGGGRWLVQCGVPNTKRDGKNPIDVDSAYKFLTGHRVMQGNQFDGVIADEFGSSEPLCAPYAKAWRKAHADINFAGKLYYPYANQLYTGPEGIELMKAVMESGSAIAWKRYLKTQSDEVSARTFIHHELVEKARQYNEIIPGSLGHMAVCFGYFSAPNEFLNTNPQGNYKTYLDMQFNLVANNPAFWGTYGLMTYLGSYADEETVRWAAHLFRYYGIEGNTEPATLDPYDSPHIFNGDFADGTQGWTLIPARKGSIRTIVRHGFGWLQGRYPSTPEGDTVLLMVRSAARPNVLKQEILDLKPGRVYTFRMITGDHKDMSKKEKHGISINLDNVDLIPGKSFTHVFDNCYSHHHGPYNRENKAWMNYHWYLFRAKGKTARLTVKDWAASGKPGGPAGQELMLNFFQVHPYFMPEEE